MPIEMIVPDSDHSFRRSIGPTHAIPQPKMQDISRKVRLTVNLPANLVEQVRDAVHWNPGLTLAWLVARALRTSLAELHATNCGPFPRRSKPLRAGRPRLAGQSMLVPALELPLSIPPRE
jgi:hypothetical protein